MPFAPPPLSPSPPLHTLRAQTLMVKALAHSANATLISLSAADVYSAMV